MSADTAKKNVRIRSYSGLHVNVNFQYVCPTHY